MNRLAWTALVVLCLSASACSDDPDPTPQPDAGDAVDSGVPGGDAGTDAGVDGGTTTGPGSSHGSGKLPCETTTPITGISNGQSYTYCLTEVAGSQLKIVEPKDTGSTEPLRLAIYLHGDGASPHNGNRAPRTHAQWTYDHRTLYVSARAPNECAWWTKPTLTACDGATTADRDTEGANAATLVKVIEALRKGWNLSNEPILFGGSSGGSVLLTASFLPKYGNAYRGIYALSCGGEAPWSGTLDWNSSDPAQLGTNKLVYTYGDKDEYLADIQGSVSWYQDAAFPLEETIIPDAAHCAFDQVGRVSEVWAAEVPN